MSASAKGSVSWNHIGLHSSSVGSLTLTPSYLQWASAVGAQDDTVMTTKKVPAANIKRAMWTVFGKSGYLRVMIKPGTDVRTPELRFDGFPEQVSCF